MTARIEQTSQPREAIGTAPHSGAGPLSAHGDPTVHERANLRRKLLGLLNSHARPTANSSRSGRQRPAGRPTLQLTDLLGTVGSEDQHESGIRTAASRATRWCPRRKRPASAEFGARPRLPSPRPRLHWAPAHGHVGRIRPGHDRAGSRHPRDHHSRCPSTAPGTPAGGRPRSSRPYLIPVSVLDLASGCRLWAAARGDAQNWTQPELKSSARPKPRHRRSVSSTRHTKWPSRRGRRGCPPPERAAGYPTALHGRPLGQR